MTVMDYQWPCCKSSPCPSPSPLLAERRAMKNRHVSPFFIAGYQVILEHMTWSSMQAHVQTLFKKGTGATTWESLRRNMFCGPRRCLIRLTSGDCPPSLYGSTFLHCVPPLTYPSSLCMPQSLHPASPFATRACVFPPRPPRAERGSLCVAVHVGV